MEKTSEKINVAVLCGGNGGKNIISTLVKNPLFKVTPVVNCYDDGKSTGYLRRVIDGFLGPSDVRKNMSYLFDNNNLSKRILKDLIEFRFPKNFESEKGIQELYNIVQQKNVGISDLDVYLKKLNYEDSVYVRIYIKQLLDYIAKKKIKFDFNDCSFGNLLLSGSFIKNNFDFNKMIFETQIVFGLLGEVQNVTNGENLMLSAITSEGEVLNSEANIVEKRSNSSVEEIFLLENYLDKKEMIAIKKLNKQKRINFLRNKELMPVINDKTKDLIEKCDILIYGPGTQNSSLFPTYLTKGFSESILRNKKCKKIFISNIGEDNEIPDATVDDIVDKALFYLNRKGELSYKKEDFFDHYLINYGNDIDPKYIKFTNKESLKNVIHANFEEDYSGKHDGNKILEELLKIYENNPTTINKIKKLSIVIPGYNEGKFLPTLLDLIKKVDLSSMGIIKEIIVVDNGSTDNTSEILKDRKDIKLFRIEKNIGKGDAVIRGIKEATGDIIVIQDADLEYNPEDIGEMLRVMLRHKFKAVYGSRTMKKSTKVKSLTLLYGKSPGQYWAYYIGGQFISVVALLLYGQYITDTVTGYKMVDARILKSFALKSKGFELDHEITAKLKKKNVYIHEVPIYYKPRTIEEGKKIKWKDGLVAIKTLFKFKFTN